jgi:hypothetical protein
MLKVIAIVLMLGAGPNGERDTYIFTDPVHTAISSTDISTDGFGVWQQRN